MNWLITPLKISVGGRDVSVPGLIARNYNTCGVGKIPDPGIFERVKLITWRPSERRAQFAPFAGEQIFVSDSCRGS